MPDLVIWTCFGLAGVCLGYVVVTGRRDAARRDRIAATLWPPPGEEPPPPVAGAPPAAAVDQPQEVERRRQQELAPVIGTPDDRIAALVVGFLLALLGTGAAAVDHKVAKRDTASVDEVFSLDLSSSNKEHAAFSRIARVHSGPLDHPLCLVRFYERARGPAGPWWTDCGQGRSLDTIGQARSRLALRHDWGPYDARVEYVIPEKSDVTYLQGTVASQCRKGEKLGCRRYRGGGQQYFFPTGLDPEGPLREERCAKSKKRPPPNSAEYVRC